MKQIHILSECCFTSKRSCTKVNIIKGELMTLGEVEDVKRNTGQIECEWAMHPPSQFTVSNITLIKIMSHRDSTKISSWKGYQ